jgi:hypothetical protein
MESKFYSICVQIFLQIRTKSIIFLSKMGPRFTNAPVHEQIFRTKTSRMTNGFLDYEHASWQQRQAESISAGVSCWLTLAQ